MNENYSSAKTLIVCGVDHERMESQSSNIVAANTFCYMAMIHVIILTEILDRDKVVRYPMNIPGDPLRLTDEGYSREK